MDTGAQRSVCGLQQARAYQQFHPTALSKLRRGTRFKFGDRAALSIGSILVRLPIDEHSHINIDIDVVDMDIPLIIGLDVLRRHKILVDYLTNTIKFCERNVQQPIKNMRGHVFYVWDAHTILFTREELIRLHTHFMHPSASKLFELISRSDPTKRNPLMKKMIDEITAACGNCKTYRSAPLRFKAAIPDGKIVFNHTILVDLLWLREKAVLQVIDEHTAFRNATFLNSKSAHDIWNALVGCWFTTYIGFPRKIRSDQESAITSELFRDYATLHGIEVEFSGVASHNSMGQIEGAHGPLRRIYSMLTDKYPTLSDNVRLRFAVKALNDTAGHNGLVPSLLVFRSIPSMGNTEADLPDQNDRFRAMLDARMEASTITAEKRIRIALKSNAPPSAKYTLRTGQLVMVYSDKQAKWVKDIRIVQVSSKQVWINYNGRIIKVNRTQVVPQPRNQQDSAIARLLRKLSPLNSQPFPNILLTEILTPNDQRGDSPAFDLAKAKEIVELLDRGAFRVVLKEDLDDGANILGGRFVLTIKHKNTDQEIFKARFVVQGHLDREKELLVHASTTVGQQAIRLLVSLATIFGFKLWSEDMTLAYIQGADKILRKVYLRGKPEFQLASNELLEILRPL